jgi:hypothetical protein
MKLSEAATIKSRARRMMRDMGELLADKSLPTGLRSQMENLRTALKKTWAELEDEATQDGGRKAVASQEANMAEVKKTVGGKAFSASDFLVVEDPEKSTTWHLQVKREGEPEPRLMGAAWAALHGGYRGNKYEGPDKAKALAALKKMYKDMDLQTPAENAEVEEIAEYMGDLPMIYVPYGVVSFTQLAAVHAAEEVAHEVGEITQQFQGMLSNIIWQSTEVAEKISMIRTLTDEFIIMLESTTAGSGDSNMSATQETDSTPPPAETSASTEEPVAEQFAEDASGFILVEAENARDPLRLDIQIIKPGWGNKNDNHYYPAEMLQRDAHVFEGAKMYVTDHRQEEKSVRTEVSVIEKVIGFTEAGAPIGRVVIFDPTFAEQVRNRASANQLSTLECSILADGKARAGFERDGRKGKIVESIVSASSVDWVTRAGAGGKALNLVENTDGSGQEPPVTEEKPKTELVAENATEPVVIREQQTGDQTPATETPAVETPVAPIALTVAEIGEALSKVTLPAKSVIALMTSTYETAEALQGAITAEIQRVKETSGSGRPFALGESASNQSPVFSSSAKIEETMDLVNKKYGIGR